MRWEVGAVGDGWDGKLVDSVRVRDGWEVTTLTLTLVPSG